MSGKLIFYLAGHVILGTLGLILLTAYVLSLSKKDPEFKSLKSNSFFAFLSFLGSWALGGLYYTSYYGKAVKPIIQKGNFAWVHSVFMETKEHVFLFLPFLSLSIFALTFLLFDELKRDRNLRFSTTVLSVTCISIGLAVLVAGMVISGAVKR